MWWVLFHSFMCNSQGCVTFFLRMSLNISKGILSTLWLLLPWRQFATGVSTCSGPCWVRVQVDEGRGAAAGDVKCKGLDLKCTSPHSPHIRDLMGLWLWQNYSGCIMYVCMHVLLVMHKTVKTGIGWILNSSFMGFLSVCQFKMG